MTALFGGAPEQAPRWDLVDIEGCGGGIRFWAPSLVVWGYVGIYRRKEYVSVAIGGPRGWRFVGERSNFKKNPTHMQDHGDA